MFSFGCAAIFHLFFPFELFVRRLVHFKIEKWTFQLDLRFVNWLPHTNIVAWLNIRYHEAKLCFLRSCLRCACVYRIGIYWVSLFDSHSNKQAQRSPSDKYKCVDRRLEKISAFEFHRFCFCFCIKSGHIQTNYLLHYAFLLEITICIST